MVLSRSGEAVGARTSQGVQGVVQFSFVLVEALQGVFSLALGSVDSVQQLVEVLQTRAEAESSVPPAFPTVLASWTHLYLLGGSALVQQVPSSRLVLLHDVLQLLQSGDVLLHLLLQPLQPGHHGVHVLLTIIKDRKSEASEAQIIS